REVRALVLGAVHERVDDVAVRRDRRQLDTTELVFGPVRLDDPARAALHRLSVRLARVGHAQRDVLQAVAVGAREVPDPRVAAEAAAHDDADLTLLEDVRCAIADAGLGAGVCRSSKAERVLVPVGGLLRVPDPQLDVIPAVQWHEIVVLTHGQTLREFARLLRAWVAPGAARAARSPLPAHSPL